MTFPPNDSSLASDEIALSQEQLQKIGIGLLCIVVLLSIVGLFCFAAGSGWKPLCLPYVKAVEDYRGPRFPGWFNCIH
jgi:hypothetical protein